jgi:predicted RNA-binding protein YlxR (DUF448 family)
VGCGAGADKRDLVRIVRTKEGDVFVDSTGRANGRGAYLCHSAECFENAMRRDRLGPALRARLQEEDAERLRVDFEEVLASEDASGQGV